MTRFPFLRLNNVPLWGFLGGSDSRESVCNARDPGSIPDPRVGKIPWRRKWQPTPVFLPGESHGRRNLVGYSPWGHKELDTTERLTLSLTPQLWDVCRPYPRIEYTWASENGFNTPDSESLQASRRRRCQEAFLSLASPFTALPHPYTTLPLFLTLSRPLEHHFSHKGNIQQNWICPPSLCC